jgi:multiple antibiotic resistance protein
MLEELIRDFVFIWTVVDPVGSIPVFIAVTSGLEGKIRRKVAIRAVAVSAGILLFFIIGGQVLLEALSIPLSAFQIAGGIVLFIFAMTMIFGESKPDSELSTVKDPKTVGDAAIFPLAVPSIASPGAMMAVVLLTDNHRYDIMEQVLTTSIMFIVLGITLVLLLLAGPIQKAIGDSGASIVSRVSGLILASVATDSILTGIKVYFLL